MDREDSISQLDTVNPDDNLIDVDEKIQKLEETQVETQVNSSTPLGSQFAVGHLHPERKGLVTGHRIPLGLLPIATQNRILGLPDDEEVDAKYVEASSFRRPARLAVIPLPSTALLPPREQLGLDDSHSFLLPPKEDLPLDDSLSAFGHPSRSFYQENEGDKNYENSLRTF